MVAAPSSGTYASLPEAAYLSDYSATRRTTPDGAARVFVRVKGMATEMVRALGPGPPQVLERCLLYLLCHMQDGLPRLVVTVTQPQTASRAPVRIQEPGFGPGGVVVAFETKRPGIGAFEVRQHRRSGGLYRCPTGPHSDEG